MISQKDLHLMFNLTSNNCLDCFTVKASVALVLELCVLWIGYLTQRFYLLGTAVQAWRTADHVEGSYSLCRCDSA